MNRFCQNRLLMSTHDFGGHCANFHFKSAWNVMNSSREEILAFINVDIKNYCKFKHPGSTI